MPEADFLDLRRPAQGPGPDLLGHPRGLAYCAATEFWDRISFHGMQALLVLYLVEYLLLPANAKGVAGMATFRTAIEAVTGTLSSQALATQIFGLYVGLIAFTPLFGGMIGDRWLGRRRSVIAGAFLMIAGHICMAFDRSFLVALLLLILGAGLLRGNLAAQVGELYTPEDQRRDTGFQIYYAALNIGGFVAPLVTGALAKAEGWHAGFGFAAVGMVVGLAIYLVGARNVPDARPPGDQARGPFSVQERRRVAALLALIPVGVMFWIAQTQIWNTYNIWARDRADLRLGEFEMPVPWLQAMDFFFGVTLLPLVLWLWARQRAHAREPTALTKLGTGCFIFGAATVWLAVADLATGAEAKVPLAWIVGFHIVSNIGYLYFAPTAVALYSRAAPDGTAARFIGVYWLSTFFGAILGGRLGGFYEFLSPFEFWLIHAAIVSGGGLLLFVSRSALDQRLAMPGAASACETGPSRLRPS